MELGKQIKMHRQEAHLSQEELANRVYVSRQTISNWENDKSYPDVNSLVLLSEIFQISLDNLIKGDIEVMKDVIQKEEIEKMNRYGKSYTIMLIATAVSAVPLFMWLGVWAFIPWGIIWAISMYFDKLGIASAREDRVFIQSRITKQYLDQYNQTYSVA